MTEYIPNSDELPDLMKEAISSIEMLEDYSKDKRKNKDKIKLLKQSLIFRNKHIKRLTGSGLNVKEIFEDLGVDKN